MDEFFYIEIRFNSVAMSPAELTLLESILPEIIREMMLVVAECEAE